MSLSPALLIFARFRYNSRMDHDRLFKELLSTFFLEFLDLFLPDVSAALDRSAAIVPMDKEIFTDVPPIKPYARREA